VVGTLVKKVQSNEQMLSTAQFEAEALGGPAPDNVAAASRWLAPAARSREGVVPPKAKAKAHFRGGLLLGADDSDDEDGEESLESP